MIVLTDLSEVLIKGMYGVENRIGELYGKKVKERFIKRRAETNSIFCELMRGRFSENTFWEVFLQGHTWPFGVTELKEFLSFNMVDEIPGSIDVFRRITSYPDSSFANAYQINGQPEIWLVSDHIAERKIELEYLHPEVFELTTRQIWSFKQSKLKKDKGFFHDLLASHGLFPTDVIFIDDLFENVCSAASAGITTIQFVSPVQLEADLGVLGFEFAEPA